MKRSDVIRCLSIVVIAIVGCVSCADAQISSGGPFTISQGAIAGGGSSSANESFDVIGTTGQSAAGGFLQSGSLSIYAGFWTPQPLAPTAAGISIRGRVLTADGQGIRGARITLTGSHVESRIAQSSTFGYYNFTNIPAGQTYILTVVSYRYGFAEPTIVVHAVDSLNGVDFIAQ